MTPPDLCPTHQIPLLTRTYCVACIGTKGGQVSSPAKTAAARANARKARPGARKPKPS